VDGSHRIANSHRWKRIRLAFRILSVERIHGQLAALDVRAEPIGWARHRIRRTRRIGRRRRPGQVARFVVSTQRWSVRISYTTASPAPGCRCGALALAGMQSDSPYVFVNQSGGPLRRSHFHRADFKPLLKAAELPSIHFHGLRHTSASLLLAGGVHAKVVQERLGHSQISMTLDTYSHLVPGMDREAAGKLEAILNLATATPNQASNVASA
jgi:integrase